jgi:hypothetical protein
LTLIESPTVLDIHDRSLTSVGNPDQDIYEGNPAAIDVSSSSHEQKQTVVDVSDSEIEPIPALPVHQQVNPTVSRKRAFDEPEAVKAEPPPKVRKNEVTSTPRQGNTTPSFIKYAAAVITGSAIGAVGTIVGLAALPQDYFTSTL